MSPPSGNHPAVGPIRILPGYALVMRDMGLSVSNVLRRARLPEDLFSGRRDNLNTSEYFALWEAIQQEAGGAQFVLRFVKTMTAEAFDPVLFAALSSRDMLQAVGRLDRFKKLIGVQRILMEPERDGAIGLKVVWPGGVDAPSPICLFELCFLVAFCRLATRTNVVPLAVRVRQKLPVPGEFREYFRTPVQDQASADELVMSAEDMRRPFLTANAKMWTFFEPMLRANLSELDATATVAARVRAALLETLAGERPTLGTVAAKLGEKPRTLQRRLKDESETFQGVLDSTRLELSRYYLGHSRVSHAEISYLLGFDDPNSFFRAFHAWTGTTPEQYRRAQQAMAKNDVLTSPSH